MLCTLFFIIDYLSGPRACSKYQHAAVAAARMASRWAQCQLTAKMCDFDEMQEIAQNSLIWQGVGSKSNESDCDWMAQHLKYFQSGRRPANHLWFCNMLGGFLRSRSGQLILPVFKCSQEYLLWESLDLTMFLIFPANPTIPPVELPFNKCFPSIPGVISSWMCYFFLFQ